ncbi:hypothetical protein AK812_SmicGene26991 [Symbiodinium microadriaticum]|uniref:Uncharacterized protein n=1 Tax=Symbiodinium microadriaticum TaxID=2951 RepID=A0A1Q9D7Z5_SYMMI|nr:hypothetical protein AK812_SmicGene26991 [Symbiodinium microadriaticum]
MDSFRLLQSAGLQDMPLAFFHQVQAVLWPEANMPHDILTAAEIEVIVKNYKEGGSVRQLARKWDEFDRAVDAEWEMAKEPGPNTKALADFYFCMAQYQAWWDGFDCSKEVDEVLAGGLTSLDVVPLDNRGEPNKTVPVQNLKEVTKYFEEIDITPKPGMIYCTSHSLKMFMSYINRRHDGSKRKEHRLKAIFDAVGRYWPAKVRSRRSLAVPAVEQEDEEEEQEEEEGEDEEEETMTEPEDENGQVCEDDAYLAESMGLVSGSPQPPSAYVGTVAYELDAETEQVVPYEACLLKTSIW